MLPHCLGRGGVSAQLFDQAQNGNVGAMKKLLEQAERGELAALNAAVKSRKPDDKPKAKSIPVGKKQEQQAMAEGVGGKFAPRPAPSSLN